MATLRTILLAAGALLAAPAAAQAPAWPTQSPRLIVPYPAGGNADAIGRLVANRIGPGLGQSVVVENRAGAGGTIGAQAVARAPGDGSMFLLAPVAILAITPHLRKVPYDPEADLVPVAMLSSSYGLMAARRDLPASSLQEFIALARKDPGKYTFGSAGAATATHITGEIVHLKAGIRLLHVPYKGSAEALTDLVASRIDLIYDPVALGQARSGNVKVLAVTSSVRHPELPNVPTLREAGIEVPAGSWFGVFAPRGTAPAVVARLAAEIEKAVTAADAREQMLKFSQYPDFKGPQAFARQVQDDRAFFKDLIERAGIKAD
ncbi:MAG: tripartite tricarboxylate transporter substrate binding protein [Burkholderiales bacterium]|nr:tripartite tricarboxylate transporter substrate binding protein [Burkholderiales bacterium]